MPRLARIFAALLLLAAASLAHAADDSLYRAFGERAGLAELMGDFVVRLKADPRIGHYFKDSKTEYLAGQLTDQLCRLAGGPCAYEGAPMRQAHQDMELTRADFNALVEVLQDAMTARGIAFSTQNDMLARLAPMHREIVTK